MCHESVVKDFDAPDRSTWRVSAVPWSRQAHGVCQIGEARAPEILHLAKQYSIVDYSFVGQNATIGDRFARSSLAVTNDALGRISSALILAIEEADACKATRGRDDQSHRVLRQAIELQGTKRKSLKELDPEISANLRELSELTTAALQQLIEGPDKRWRDGRFAPKAKVASCPPATLQLEMCPTALLGTCSAAGVLRFAL